LDDELTGDVHPAATYSGAALAARVHSDVHAFTYRAGVRLRGTIVACDATAGSDLIFLSHARALDARATHALPRGHGGKRRILTTDLTLALLGGPGERLRPHALLAPLGRPFTLGALRLELFPSGLMPGAASLLCEVGGRRVVYAGPVGAEPGAEVRTADALCLSATFGARHFRFPPRAEALAEVATVVTDALARGSAPVVLVDTLAAALDVGATLGARGVGVRVHRSVMQVAAAFRGAGQPAPMVQRFDGRLRPNEALLWPWSAWPAARLGALDDPTVVLASPRAVESGGQAAGLRGVVLAEQADFAGLLRYVAASGASEVALVGAPGDELPDALHERGVVAYRLGPPRQIGLFASSAAAPIA
jgi:hypothetical protein